MKALKAWKSYSHRLMPLFQSQTHPQRDCAAAESHWFWIFRVDVLIPSLPRRKLKLKGTQSFPKMKQRVRDTSGFKPMSAQLESLTCFPHGAAPFLEIICLLCVQGPLSAGLPSVAYSLKLLLADFFLLNFYFIFGNTQNLTQTRLHCFKNEQWGYCSEIAGSMCIFVCMCVTIKGFLRQFPNQKTPKYCD